VGFAILASFGSKGTIGGTVRATLTHTQTHRKHIQYKETQKR